MMKETIKKIIYPLVRYTPIYRYLQHRKESRILEYLKNQSLNQSYDPNITPIIEVVNLNADDICNSRCVMCNIWKQPKTYEFTPMELKNILKDPLFKNVKSIGVTGGEPTLREDLSLIYTSIFEALPNIEGASIITNAINEKDVIQRIEEVISVCEKYKKDFSIMISLDGVGVVHERVRRRKGNFESALNVLNHFKNRNIPVITGSTISKVNVWDVDELLDFYKENKIYGRFRIAEFINRIYNSDRTDVIRNFSEDEIYHLILFFYKLIYTFEFDETFRRTYKNIINILSGGDRLIGCPYHKSGVVLNSRAELAYCAPKSKIIGSALNESALTIYKENLEEKKRIIEENCSNCIHDYHSPITYQEKKIELDDIKWRNIISINNIDSLPSFRNVSASKLLNFQVFITGWYGSETVGDKAILGQIIDDMYDIYGHNISIIVSSLFPIITRRTLNELNVTENYKVVNVYSEEFISYIKGSDLVIMGGGPLMDIDEVCIPYIAFKLAKKNRKKTIIYGCGLGPLNSDKHISAVKDLLSLSDEIKVRDHKSAKLASEWMSGLEGVEMIGDPAKRYISKFKCRNVESDSDIKPKILTCFLRELTYEYIKNMDHGDFLSYRTNFEEHLATFIKNKAEENNVTEIYLDHMHNFVWGNDDRDFSRRFIKSYFQDYSIPISYNKKLSTIESVVSSMQNSHLNICMRFHSVVFAHTLDTNFIAVDYTKGGKILNFLTDNESLDKIISLDDVICNE